MKTISAVAVGLVLIAVAGICRNTNRLNTPLTELTSSAYQDGIYLGGMAAKNGEVPHVTSARWSADKDRALFGAGYEQGYTDILMARKDTASVTSAAFRDGLFLGSQAVQRGEPSPPSVGRWTTAADRALFEEGYQQAYTHAVVQTAANVR